MSWPVSYYTDLIKRIADHIEEQTGIQSVYPGAKSTNRKGALIGSQLHFEFGAAYAQSADDPTSLEWDGGENNYPGWHPVAVELVITLDVRGSGADFAGHALKSACDAAIGLRRTVDQVRMLSTNMTKTVLATGEDVDIIHNFAYDCVLEIDEPSPGVTIENSDEKTIRYLQSWPCVLQLRLPSEV